RDLRRDQPRLAVRELGDRRPRSVVDPRPVLVQRRVRHRPVPRAGRAARDLGDRVLMRALAVVAVAGLGAARLVGATTAQPTGRVVGTVKVTEADGQPAVADVVVYVTGFNEPPTDKVTKIAQKGRKFVPDLVAITVGEKVEFPNFDPFLHNVFSQSV